MLDVINLIQLFHSYILISTKMGWQAHAIVVESSQYGQIMWFHSHGQQQVEMSWPAFLPSDIFF